MAHLAIRNLVKEYANGTRAIGDVSLDANDGEFLVLLGPSGCGKSTLLRCIAGLEEPSSGTISIDDQDIGSVAPKDRDVAMVFQNYALYPHMTVRRIMGFPLKMRGLAKAAIEPKVAEAARMLGLEDLLDRKPRELSGGQRQRVALGRSLVRDPKLFLFDEPLSNLDAKLRVEIRAEIRQLHMRRRSTCVYVTHDQEEAMTLGTRIAVLEKGSLRQCGSPLEIYDRPASRFVAAFLGTPRMNFVDGNFAACGGMLPERFAGRDMVVGFRPQSVRLLAPGSEGLPASVTLTEILGDRSNVHLITEKGAVIAQVDSQTRIEPGENVVVWVAHEHLHYFDSGPEGLAIRSESV